MRVVLLGVVAAAAGCGGIKLLVTPEESTEQVTVERPAGPPSSGHTCLLEFGRTPALATRAYAGKLLVVPVYVGKVSTDAWGRTVVTSERVVAEATSDAYRVGRGVFVFDAGDPAAVSGGSLVHIEGVCLGRSDKPVGPDGEKGAWYVEFARCRLTGPLIGGAGQRGPAAPVGGAAAQPPVPRPE